MSTGKEDDEHFGVLPGHMGGGPHGLGDPDDKTLRKVEKEIIIPKRMKTKAAKLCSEYVEAFSECGKTAGLLLPFKCRKENRAMQECIVKWYQEPGFYKKCKEEYLESRSEYRRTGVSREQKRKEMVGF